MATCPFCKSQVTPQRDAAGKLLCPACGNTGRVAPAPRTQVPAATAAAPAVFTRAPALPLAAPSMHPVMLGTPTRNAPGALASLVMGILAFFTSVFGIVFAILAIVFGHKARRFIAESGGYLGGGGMAKAGRILGWCALAFIVVILFAAIVFVLITKLGGASAPLVDNSVDIPAGRSYFQGWVMYAAADTMNYTVEATTGTVTAGFYPVADASDPQPTTLTGWAEHSGTTLQGSAKLTRGSYALGMTCDAITACSVHYSIYKAVKPAGATLGTGSMPPADRFFTQCIRERSSEGSDANRPCFQMETDDDGPGGSVRFANVDTKYTIYWVDVTLDNGYGPASCTLPTQGILSAGDVIYCSTPGRVAVIWNGSGQTSGYELFQPVSLKD